MHPQTQRLRAKLRDYIKRSGAPVRDLSVRATRVTRRRQYRREVAWGDAAAWLIMATPEDARAAAADLALSPWDLSTQAISRTVLVFPKYPAAF